MIIQLRNKQRIPAESNTKGSRPRHHGLRRVGTSVLMASIFAVSLPLLAETPEEKGLAIAVEADKRNIGFIDTTADMKMILRNRAGKESLRRMRSRVLEVQGDGDKSLTIFDDPKDVKGTASLTFSHSIKPDEQ